MVTIGLYHGVLFLPVVLSCIGPEAHRSHVEHDLIVDEQQDTSRKGEEVECLNVIGNETVIGENSQTTKENS